MALFRGERFYQLLISTVVILLSVMSLYPLLYVIAVSLVNEQEWTASGGFILWPKEPTLQAYRKIFEGPAFVTAFGISVLRTFLGTALTLAATTITAYAVSRRSLPGRSFLLFMIVATILFNSGLIPSYLVVKDLGMLDTIWSLVIPGAVDSWSVLVLKQFFDNIPKELEESARIDGAGEFKVMTRIMLPMSVPAFAAIGLFMAVAHWNSWFDAMIYITDATRQPLQLLIRNLFVSVDLGAQFNSSMVTNPSARVAAESLKMAVVVIGIIPILCIYPFLQKHFTKGMYVGAVKG